MTCSYLFLNLLVFCNRWWPSYQIAQPLLSTIIVATWHYWTCLFDPNFLAILSKFHGYELTFIIYSQTLDWPTSTSTFLQTHLSKLDTLLHLELCIRTNLTKSGQTNQVILHHLPPIPFTMEFTKPFIGFITCNPWIQYHGIPKKHGLKKPHLKNQI